MFDFAWSEIAVIGLVALVAIGPKDMPVAIRAAARMMKRARGLASEFQTHVDDLVREADLHDVRDQLNSLRGGGASLRDRIERTVDPDGSVRRTLRDSPMRDAPKPPVGLSVEPPAEHSVDLRPPHEIPRPPDMPAPLPPPPPVEEPPSSTG